MGDEPGSVSLEKSGHFPPQWYAPQNPGSQNPSLGGMEGNPVEPFSRSPLLDARFQPPDRKITYGNLKRMVLDLFIKEVPMEGTDAYGELGLWRELDGKRFIQNRTSIPHLWNGGHPIFLLWGYTNRKKLLP